MADPIARRRIFAEAVGGVLFWRAVALLLGLPPILGTATGLAPPVTRAVAGRMGREIPDSVDRVIYVVAMPGQAIGSWAYPTEMVMLPAPMED
jgi:hypothetical protein